MELVEGPAHPFLAGEEDARSLQIGSWALGLLLGTGQNTRLFTLGTGLKFTQVAQVAEGTQNGAQHRDVSVLLDQNSYFFPF